MNSRIGAPIQASERRGGTLAVHSLLNDIAEWGRPEAPQRRVVFARIDRIVAHRSPGRPSPNPRTARPTDYPRRSAPDRRSPWRRPDPRYYRCLAHINPHHLRYTYATALDLHGRDCQNNGGSDLGLTRRA
ncbi:hypothetical protein [Mycobacterium intracellulare]|uniref:hypothetical protein n=1 Tax=Mycobacterium intracellulare TaxID=1767 RepID=UPI00109EA443|nr:hypothetical protein [Mycobacterium intracellulare]